MSKKTKAPKTGTPKDNVVKLPVPEKAEEKVSKQASYSELKELVEKTTGQNQRLQEHVKNLENAYNKLVEQVIKEQGKVEHVTSMLWNLIDSVKESEVKEAVEKFKASQQVEPK